MRDESYRFLNRPFIDSVRGHSLLLSTDALLAECSILQMLMNIFLLSRVLDIEVILA